MKRYLIFIIFSFLALSCQKTYEKHYDLAVDALNYTLPSEGDSFPLYIYASGIWTASFETPVSWISISECSGEGVGYVRVTYQDNDVALREVNLIITSAGKSVTVHISQKYNSTHLVVL